MKTKPSSVEEIRKQTRNLIDEHKKSIQDFHENHFPHLFGREGMSDAEQEIGRLTLALAEAEKKAERDYLRFVDADREEIKRLCEENARYKSSYQKYVEATDRMNGTPCEQIRHQQEVDALREENARLREALEPFAPDSQWIDPAIPDGRPIYAMFLAGELRAAAAAIREGGKDDAS